uniref:Ribosomal RNA large subunit methyltransferase K/L-like methyltransferase domain-containing protein n=1 Tax=Proboscia inermis TaxID=420281 RepID=A0A7S0CEU3_9STRA|mmetsp:Transcript_42705/g.43265  ORF Transcript_42705/g.43265 Transcript_42705/m.43265 type:complete len:210 (+) Transcript_42705:208-837(+)
MAADVAPGLIRQRYAEGGKDYIPPAMRWKDYTTTPDTWDALLAEAIQRRKEGMKWLTNPESTCVIQGNEQYRPALELAKSGSAGAGFNEQSITYQNQDCLNYHPSTMIPGRTIVATNPPWGLRLDTDIEESWGSLKQFLRKEVGGCEAWVLCGNKDLTRILRMKQTKRIPIRTGEEDLRWVQYHVFPPKVASPETDVAENKEEEEVFVQ